MNEMSANVILRDAKMIKQGKYKLDQKSLN